MEQEEAMDSGIDKIDTEKLGQGWRELSEGVISGMREWREQHPKTTFREIETELDERLSRLGAKMLQDTVLASSQADWSERPKARVPGNARESDPLAQSAAHPWYPGASVCVTSKQMEDNK